MEIANTRCLALAMLMVAIILISGNHEVSAYCEASAPALISQCSKSVQKAGPKIPPSADCCAVVKGIDIYCVCELIIYKASRKYDRL
uniref:Bifunctional inhibitor/plant lipid transfer protein/seed storage helical domain-containing protein n=1 Tax=Fagus sylvatica TaxID=28930 RepID=A0A2N9EMX6_FAGSY